MLAAIVVGAPSPRYVCARMDPVSIVGRVVVPRSPDDAVSADTRRARAEDVEERTLAPMESETESWQSTEITFLNWMAVCSSRMAG